MNMATWIPWRRRVHPKPETGADLFVQAKLLAQSSAHQKLGWGRSHRLMQVSLEAGKRLERERLMHEAMADETDWRERP